ncbi:MAG: hypothetical protein M0P99_01845 [Candidatus Cloacimonetes bacterium]|nr:hypothetical protein [Candidatus Cloacimonadota bacterium]
MTKKNKNGKEQAETLKLGVGMKVIEMDKSGYDEPDMVSDCSDQDDPLANAYHYKN